MFKPVRDRLAIGAGESDSLLGPVHGRFKRLNPGFNVVDHRRVPGTFDHLNEPIERTGCTAISRRCEVVRSLDTGVLDWIIVVGERLKLYPDDLLGAVLRVGRRKIGDRVIRV